MPACASRVARLTPFPPDRRKSVVGLSFDFLAFNIIGHSCYLAYNLALLPCADPSDGGRRLCALYRAALASRRGRG